MGFDIECIIDIQTYPGEYFCPVCRTLVYPNEALQSLCSHLYCKPCLAHIANGSKACPYDGYLVTESDSKPLIESDKTLVEKIGKVKVHCLFFRSGCTWEGTLSDCTSHCSECSFGNSPVICNRCGIQIVHRQVHDHAQSCPGVYETQSVTGVTSSVTASAANTTDLKQTVSQLGPPLSQSQNPQNISVTQQTGQNLNQTPIANYQAPNVAPVSSVPTTEQWYQQQYQQYASYNPYQQPHQQYYSLQQQSFQQYQQNPLPVHGQPPSHAYTHLQAQPLAQIPARPQTQLQTQPQPQPQPQHILQTPQQPNFQQLVQGQPQPHPQSQSQSQSQPQVVSQAPSHVQVPLQGKLQLRPHAQALPLNNHVNLQQQQQPLLMHPHAQISNQFPLPPPHSQSTPPLPYANTLGLQLQPAAQHPQMNQTPLHMHHSHTSQVHVQTQPQSQPQFQTQTLSQPQQQVPLYHNQFPQVRPSPPNQANAIAVLPQTPQIPASIPASSVSGHRSFPQQQQVEQMQSGTPQQYPMLHHTSGSLHPKVQGQVPQLPALMRPPPSHGSLPLQQSSTFLPPQTQLPGILPTNQQLPPHAQPPMHHPQYGTMMQAVQQAVPMQISQKQPHLSLGKGQLHQESHFPQQLPLQPQLHQYGSHQSLQSQNYVARPMIPNEGIHPQNHSQSFVGNQNFIKSTMKKEDSFSNKQVVVPGDGIPDQRLAGKDVIGSDVKPFIEVVMSDASEPHTKISKDKVEAIEGESEKLSGATSFETRTAEANANKGDGSPRADFHIWHPVDHENKMEGVVVGPPSKDFDKVPHIPDSRPEASAKENPSSVVGPQGSGMLPHSGQSPSLTASTPNSGRAPHYYGHPPRNFESSAAPQGPLMATPNDPLRIVGKTPSLRLDVQSGLQDLGKANEAAMVKEQRAGSTYMSGSDERVSHRQTYGNEQPSFWRTDGETDIDSSKLGFRDHLNPISLQPTRPLDQALRPLDKAPPRSSYDTGMQSVSGVSDPPSRFLPPHHTDALGPNSEFGRPVKHFPSLNPDGDYLGISPYGFGGPSSFPRGTSVFDDVNAREAHKFGEGSRSFNQHLDPVGSSFNNRSFPHIPGHLRGGEIDGSKNFGFGEHVTRGPLHRDAVRPDGPGPLARGGFSGPGYFSGHFVSEAAGPGVFSGHSHVGEYGGQGNFHHHVPFGEFVRGNRSSIPLFGDPSLQTNYQIQGFPKAGNFVGGVDSFDQIRKRRPISMGWCRICKFDCDTVEGLEMHSQTREHQRMAMDLVRTIKQNNKKRQRSSAGHVAHEVGSKNRKVGINGRGSKP